jgi:hypothetical protein
VGVRRNSKASGVVELAWIGLLALARVAGDPVPTSPGKFADLPTTVSEGRRGAVGISWVLSVSTFAEENRDGIAHVVHHVCFPSYREDLNQER